MILEAPLLDSSCLFPKPIRVKNVLATGAHLFGINYQRICVDASLNELRDIKLNWTAWFPAPLIPSIL